MCCCCCVGVYVGGGVAVSDVGVNGIGVGDSMCDICGVMCGW